MILRTQAETLYKQWLMKPYFVVEIIFRVYLSDFHAAVGMRMSPSVGSTLHEHE